jgi:hypothetical protein
MDNQWWGCKNGWSCKSVGHGSACADGAHRYCDQQTRDAVKAGDTVSFFYRTTSKDAYNASATATAPGSEGSVSYEMGWTANGQGATIRGSGPAPSTKLTGGRCEHHDTPVKYPKSPFKTFDLVAKDQHGNKLTPKWDCRTPAGEKGISIKCTASEITVTFPDSVTGNATAAV